MGISIQLSLGEHTPAVAERLAQWQEEQAGARLWQGDHTLWSPEPQPELVDRLGWLTLPGGLSATIDDLRTFGAEVATDGFRDAVVLGMGGSSLAPEVYQATFGNRQGHPRLSVLDSTHPGAVATAAARIDPATTLFIVSSKSGNTLETLSFFRFFWAEVAAMTDNPGHHFVAVTDPGSALETLANDRGFRRVFSSPPDVGGRYSALTEFGLVPAAVIGVDLAALALSARAAAAASGPDTDPLANPGLQLGAALGELALADVDKVTFVPGSGLEAFPAWIEQLIAESTGKEGKGIVPIGGEITAGPDVYAQDRFFIGIGLATDDSLANRIEPLADAGHPVASIRLDDLTDLGGAMFTLEVAVAMAGSALEINPFNQPDVQVAKDLARQAMAGELQTSTVEEIDALDPDLADHVASWLATVSRGDYVGIHAFIEPNAQAREILGAMRHAVRDHRRVATTLDYGPRFLHSTGQLHKGGPNSGAFLQIIDHPAPHVAVPETDFDFGKLVTAQALGDHQALQQRGRRLLMVCLGDTPEPGLTNLAKAVETAVA